MADYNQDFNEVMELLQTVPGVTEHLNSLQVRLGKEILKRRMELGWTQSTLVKNCALQGISITQPMLSKMESGMKNIEARTYQNVISVLGGIEELDIKFGPVPNNLPSVQKKSKDLMMV